MTLLLISDLETDGANPLTCNPIEVAGILYDMDHGTIAQLSVLLPILVNPAEEHNGIPASATCVVKPTLGLSLLEQFLEQCDYVVGHNFKAFDNKIFGRELLPEIKKPILDTMIDVKFPRSSHRKGWVGLDKVAQDHLVPVWKAHRALTDCQLIAHIFDSYSVSDRYKLIEKALEPRFLYMSLEAYPSSTSKEYGFKFERENGKRWVKWLTQGEFESLPFNVVKVDS
jgi:DNA polymerase III subunit epsilon